MKEPLSLSSAMSTAVAGFESASSGANVQRTAACEQEEAPPGVGTRILSAVDTRAFSPALAICTTLLAAVIGLLLPIPVTAMLMMEGGPVENATSVIYLVAIAALWHGYQRGGNPTTRIALSVVLAGFLGRELDLHKTTDGVSLLKLSSYADLSGASAKLAVAGAAVATVVAAVVLLRRHGRVFFRRSRIGDSLAFTVLSFLILLVLSKIGDRAPVMLAEYTGVVLAPAVRYVVLAIEEIAELMLPLLVIVGVIQHAMTRRQAVRAPNGQVADAHPH